MAAVALVPNWRQHKGDVRNHNRRGFLLLLLPMTAPSGPRRGDTGLRQTTPKAIQAAAAVAVVPTGITALHSAPCGALRPLTNTGPDTRRRSSSRNRKRRTPRATMSSRIRRPFRVTAATTTKTTSGTSVWFASGGCISKNTAASRAARGRAGRPSERPNARVRATLYVAEAFLSPFNLFPLSIHLIVRFWVLSFLLSCPTHLSPDLRSPQPLVWARAPRLDKQAQPRLLLCCCVSSPPSCRLCPPCHHHHFPCPGLLFSLNLLLARFPFSSDTIHASLSAIDRIYSRGHSAVAHFWLLSMLLIFHRERSARKVLTKETSFGSRVNVYSSSRSSGIEVAPRRPGPPGLRVRLTASRWRLRATPRSVSRILRWFSSISSCDSCRQKLLAGAS